MKVQRSGSPSAVKKFVGPGYTRLLSENEKLQTKRDFFEKRMSARPSSLGNLVSTARVNAHGLGPPGIPIFLIWPPCATAPVTWPSLRLSFRFCP